MYKPAHFAKNTKKVFFEGNMQENGELFQKYCAHIGGRVTVVSAEGGRACLSSHLCHGQKCEERNFNTVQGKACVRGIDINEK